MTEEQRVKLEELISQFEQVVANVVASIAEGSEYALSEVEKARDRITKHLDKIQWSAATYNLRRGGTSVFMDVDNKDEDGVGVDLPKCLVESPQQILVDKFATLCKEEREMTIKLKEIHDKMIHNMDKQGEDFGDKGEDCPVCDSWSGNLPGARVHDRDHTRTGSCIYAHDEWVRSQVLKQRKEEEEKKS